MTTTRNELRTIHGTATLAATGRAVFAVQPSLLAGLLLLSRP